MHADDGVRAAVDQHRPSDNAAIGRVADAPDLVTEKGDRFRSESIVSRHEVAAQCGRDTKRREEIPGDGSAVVAFWITAVGNRKAP